MRISLISVVGLFSTIIVKYNIKKVKVCCLDLDCTKPKKNKRVKNSKILEEIDDEKYIEKDRITITNTLESELKPKPKLKPIPILIAKKKTLRRKEDTIINDIENPVNKDEYDYEDEYEYEYEDEDEDEDEEENEYENDYEEEKDDEDDYEEEKDDEDITDVKKLENTIIKITNLLTEETQV